MPLLFEHEKIRQWLEEQGVTRFHITEKGLVNVEKSVDLSRKDLTYIPIQFGYVMGDFDISGNKLVTLKGSPLYVYGDFEASGNNLTTLKHTPKRVTGAYNVSMNEIEHLNYFSTQVEGSIYLSGNHIKELKNMPQTVNGTFDVSSNLLTSLNGAPQEVKGDLWAACNQLLTTKGINFCYNLYIFDNPLNDLVYEDLPEVSGYIHIEKTKIKAFEDALANMPENYSWQFTKEDLKPYLLYNVLANKMTKHVFRKKRKI